MRDHPKSERPLRIDGFLAQGLRGIAILGIVAQVVNFDAIAVFAGGLKEIVGDQPPVWPAAVTVFVVLVAMLLPYCGPAVVYAFSPERSGKALARRSDWMLDNSRWLEIIVGLGYGSAFLWKGLAAP